LIASAELQEIYMLPFFNHPGTLAVPFCFHTFAVDPNRSPT